MLTVLDRDLESLCSANSMDLLQFQIVKVGEFLRFLWPFQNI
jgi:hypothetical protein